MYLSRAVDKILLSWKSERKRKPLLIRGARQVGKTDTVRHLAENFKYFVEVNFEENKSIKSIFKNNLSPTDICENLSAIYNLPIVDGETLLFLDEIQSCTPALQSLRFFYEQRPNLHIIAAGSLLEFALAEIPSYGVGRIRSVFMYPLSFNEYMVALGKNSLLELKQNASSSLPLTESVHIELLKIFNKFLLLGGMPEVISNYVETKDISECIRIIDDLIFSYNDDFAKYKKKFPTKILKEVFDSVIMQTGNKFIYSKAGGANHNKIKEGLNLLILAGLVIPVSHTAANGLPLGAEVNSKKRKMLILDTGLFMRILGLDITEFLLSDNLSVINKGNLAEMFVGLELLKYKSPYERMELYYWHREAKSSNAEVDFIYTKNSKIYPIEVKSGSKGSMQSMFIFMKEKNALEGIRISTENFTCYDNISVYPLYAVDRIN